MEIQYVHMLPYQIVEKIWFYLDDISKAVTCKDYYLCYHTSIINSIVNFDSYVRSMIRNDCNFVFKLLLNEKIEEWNKNKKLTYHNKIYYNYLQYVIDLCIYNKSDKCKSIITYKNPYEKNSHKKNKIKSIKWTN